MTNKVTLTQELAKTGKNKGIFSRLKLNFYFELKNLQMEGLSKYKENEEIHNREKESVLNLESSKEDEEEEEDVDYDSFDDRDEM